MEANASVGIRAIWMNQYILFSSTELYITHSDCEVLHFRTS